MARIRHVWFDFSDTIATVNRDRHNQVKYDTFASLSGIPHNPERQTAYRELYEKHGRSNAEVFAKEFGVPSGYWSEQLAATPFEELYQLADPDIPRVLKRLSELAMVSIFSNIDTVPLLPALGIDPSIFTHVLSASVLAHPKPHEEGYRKIVELSKLPPRAILYVGDIEEKDILPAKAVGLATGIIWNESDAAEYNFSSFQDILNTIEARNE